MPTLPLPSLSEVLSPRSDHSSPASGHTTTTSNNNDNPYYIPATTLDGVNPLGWILIGLLTFCFVMSFLLGQCLLRGQPTSREKERMRHLMGVPQEDFEEVGWRR
ncbi:hypothetical protein NEUTE1DRAFT_98760 [Neurospora tetrasperma FGSC 2508]|uniref:Uncharacterized protein n=1 Tax=Neurospora tetrasperma (strain FGSC 2508 / ATCC MYA-4615 / P0657) TaxID=510951 RepID=F8MEQ5_NEUT8|nr:uncharacterized protein NEUTE1DRAFT_98760 [Neurospora tetrasperma FGSC 2508]EGO61684.1 hypothetical protein NEUTE1DRAFT_98760 [Neurospora tetrasperma FGSC 2508]EGZ74263.1 hypothetical protein NEUTE2DRAFT_163321 [Neurospora tetrasperma FGSC 2509]